jgi:hypothetical protein
MPEYRARFVGIFNSLFFNADNDVVALKFADAHVTLTNPLTSLVRIEYVNILSRTDHA